jgi:hypothetical protein
MDAKVFKVTSKKLSYSKTYRHEGLKVLVNSNSRDKMIANFKRIDDLNIGESVEMTDNYGGMGGGDITIERTA